MKVKTHWLPQLLKDRIRSRKSESIKYENNFISAAAEECITARVSAGGDKTLAHCVRAVLHCASLHCTVCAAQYSVYSMHCLLSFYLFRASDLLIKLKN